MFKRFNTYNTNIKFSSIHTNGLSIIASSLAAICLCSSMTRVMSYWIFWNISGVLYFWGSSLNTTMPSFWLIAAKISPDLICETCNIDVTYLVSYKPLPKA